MPSLVLGTKLLRPFVLMFSSSFGFRNMLHRVLYISHASAAQWHAVCTLSSLSSPHSREFWRCVSLNLNIWTLKVVWPVNSPTASLSLSMLISWISLFLGRGSFFSVLDWRQTWQAFNLSRCSGLKWLLMTSFPTANGIPAGWSEGNSLIPSLPDLLDSSFPGIPWCPGIHSKVTIRSTLLF